MMNGTVVEEGVRSLGRGFDLTSDFKLKYCKGQVVVLSQDAGEVSVPGFGPIRDVSSDIKCDKGESSRVRSDILDFCKMSEHFNRKSSVTGKTPTGYFNATFGFQSGCWADDATNTRWLGLDGYFITLLNLHLDRRPLRLADHVVDSVPPSWDPAALARFIEEYGTHVVVGLGMGGQDVVVVKQDKSSNLEPSELKKHLNDLCDQLFTGSCTFTASKTKDTKSKVPEAFNVFDDRQTVAFNSFSVNSKKGITVVCSKRGGDLTAQSHNEWLLTVPSMPDAIHFSFVPITSLLNGVPGKGFLSHAINLYLRYKPPVADLVYFLDFQSQRIWAPIHNDLPLGAAPNMPASSPALYLNMMGPKLYVNTTQVTTGRRPVTGMRLYLEGMKCKRLAIHLQHLSSTGTILHDKIGDTLFWQGSDDVRDHERYLEGINSKKFSHICTAPVKYNPEWTDQPHVVFIVTGAQLHVKKHGSKSVLHLRLLFSRVSDNYIIQKDWSHGSQELNQKSGLFSAISMSLAGNQVNKQKEEAFVLDSSVYPKGPPAQTNKMLKFVDMSQRCRGPQDSPGHWLVTGARLYLEKGKICLHVKFSLLNRL